MLVTWTRQALESLEETLNFIAVDNRKAANSLNYAFVKATETISMFPEIGKLGKLDGTREYFPHENYRLVYSIDVDVVYIIDLVHAARQWPAIR